MAGSVALELNKKVESNSIGKNWKVRFFKRNRGMCLIPLIVTQRKGRIINKVIKNWHRRSTDQFSFNPGTAEITFVSSREPLRVCHCKTFAFFLMSQLKFFCNHSHTTRSGYRFQLDLFAQPDKTSYITIYDNYY